jgi:hypothetical protein
MTTHSPVVLRELARKQLFVVRRGDQSHEIIPVVTGVQSTIRLYPDAFLAPSVLVCEGASEVGLIRGLEIARASVRRLAGDRDHLRIVERVAADSNESGNFPFKGLNSAPSSAYGAFALQRVDD